LRSCWRREANPHRARTSEGQVSRQWARRTGGVGERCSSQYEMKRERRERTIVPVGLPESGGESHKKKPRTRERCLDRFACPNNQPRKEKVASLSKQKTYGKRSARRATTLNVVRQEGAQLIGPSKDPGSTEEKNISRWHCLREGNLQGKK